MKYPVSAAAFFAILSACGTSDDTTASSQTAETAQPSAQSSEVPVSTDFSAQISGAISGPVNGGGVLNFIEGAGYDEQGYFFLADGTGIRDYGVTFVLPSDVTTGRYDLQSPNPLDIGTVASVRVDHDTGTATVSWERNTDGFLNITAIPARGETGPVEGDFEFTTENADGDGVTVTGRFDFEHEG